MNRVPLYASLVVKGLLNPIRSTENKWLANILAMASYDTLINLFKSQYCKNFRRVYEPITILIIYSS